jgi:predicted nucleic acid-binding Zn ribbon protein
MLYVLCPMLNLMMKKPIPIRSILEETIKGLEIELPLKTHSIFGAWRNIVGEAVALQTRPRAIRNRILFIDVSHSTWMQQLQFFKPTLLEKINAFLGESLIDDIRFKLGKISPPLPTPSEAPSWREETLDVKTTKQIEALLQSIPDGEIRKSLHHVLIKGAKLERHRKKTR